MSDSDREAERVAGPRRVRAPIALALLGLALVLAAAAGVGLGAVPVSPADALRAIGRALGGGSHGLADAVVVDLRLPRVVLAALVGAGLASAGVLYQALFRNPLADPYILGVSAGAGLGATIALVLGAGSVVTRLVGVPLGSFAGAAVTILIVARLASRAGRMQTASLLLAGVAVSYTLAAATSFILVYSRKSMADVVYWMMGGLSGATWGQVAWLAAAFALGFAVPALSGRELNLMLLGDERASQLGVDVRRFERMALASASLLVAAAVSVSGLIGFVGLMTPHMVRLVLGPDHRLLLPASALGGATVLVVADLLARVVLAPVELPVGIVTAMLGGPFFLWLLVRRETVR
jgi:iron complex transport system permease protein